ncbi:MAG: hypothetical protein OSA84_07655 [Akkermansiaceae bacterium]|nr:hypothetical protein [Akkermansiaceae bacterium]
MDPINPWLDPAEVRHLAEQLLRPVTPTHLSAANPGFDSSFVGFTPPESVAAPAPAPAAEPELQAPATPPQAPPRETEAPHREAETNLAAISESPQPPPVAPSRTRFLERIRIFRDWLAKNFHATDIFILDREGKVIFDESGHDRLHFMARNLALASRSSGNIHVKIGPVSILEVISCETPYGRIVLGSIVPEALPANHVQTITEVLIQTASPT